ncbi:MAG: GNAT family N-acetyltransferase [Actinomycetota bacterium]
MQISPWKSHDDVANMVPFPDRVSIGSDALLQALDLAREQGYASTFTAALTPTQAEPFRVAGFELVEELHLLRRALDSSFDARPDRSSLRRGRRTDFAEVLELDALAFDDFWRFDRGALADSMRATPRHRFQVSKTDPVIGYHVTGLAGASGYLQRVAVHPSAQGEGWGMRLVDDALRWSWRNGARTVHVNTQLTNERAVGLYRRCGFELAPERLQVLWTPLVDGASRPF